MRSIRRGSLLVVCATVVAVAGPAVAERPACGDLLSARQLGRSAEEVAREFRTTSVRIAACERVAEQHERLEAQRRHVDAARTARLSR